MHRPECPLGHGTVGDTCNAFCCGPRPFMQCSRGGALQGQVDLLFEKHNASTCSLRQGRFPGQGPAGADIPPSVHAAPIPGEIVIDVRSLYVCHGLLRARCVIHHQRRLRYQSPRVVRRTYQGGPPRKGGVELAVQRLGARALRFDQAHQHGEEFRGRPLETIISRGVRRHGVIVFIQGKEVSARALSHRRVSMLEAARRAASA